ncbi:MAG TPA: RidA family protein [Acidimicrobiales bacterium]|nr:RidA family protein [Acidimicrobiales bacterium]
MPAPIGPYSPIVRAGPWLVSSGQLGVEPNPDPSSAPALVVGGVAAQLTQALANGERLLEGEGASRSDVIKTTVFVTDMDDFATVNQAYSSFFGDHRPARSVIGVVALPLGALVEVELWAYQPS